MFDTLSQTTAIIFAATSRAVLASPRPPAPCPGGCFWGFGFPQFEQYEIERREDLVVSLSLREGVNGEMQRRAMLLALPLDVVAGRRGSLLSSACASQLGGGREIVLFTVNSQSLNSPNPLIVIFKKSDRAISELMNSL